MKRFLTIVVCTLLVLSVACLAESTNIKILFNGVRLTMLNENGDIEQPIIQDGQVYVPLKSFIETIGGKYEYDEESSTIAVTLDNGSKQEGNTTTSKKRVEITKDNFFDFFDKSASVTDISSSKSRIQSMVFYNHTGRVNLSLDAVNPFEMHDIKFEIKVKTESSLNEREADFTGTIPQSGSYSSMQEISWGQIVSDKNMKVVSIEVISASGYIMIDE